MASLSVAECVLPGATVEMTPSLVDSEAAAGHRLWRFTPEDLNLLWTLNLAPLGKSLGFTWFDLVSLGLTWFHFVSLGSCHAWLIL